MNLKLNDRWDIDISEGRTARVSGTEYVAQLVRNRLLTVQTEWFIDRSIGLPWFVNALGSASEVGITTIVNMVKKITLNTQGVLTIEKFDYTFKDRVLNISMTVRTVYGLKNMEGISIGQ